MLYAFGIGEIAMSFSGDSSATHGALTHTIRCVGATGWALHEAPVGTVIAIATALLRSGDHRRRLRCGRHRGRWCSPRWPSANGMAGLRFVDALIPQQPLYRAELDRWAGDQRLEVQVTVGAAEPGWLGAVGVITQPLRHRNMRRAIGWCGHCQLGPVLLCWGGPARTRPPRHRHTRCETEENRQRAAGTARRAGDPPINVRVGGFYSVSAPDDLQQLAHRLHRALSCEYRRRVYVSWRR